MRITTTIGTYPEPDDVTLPDSSSARDAGEVAEATRAFTVAQAGGDVQQLRSMILDGCAMR